MRHSGAATPAAPDPSSQDELAQAESALSWLSGHCDVAVVTLGERGCIVKQQGDSQIIHEPAAKGVKVVDATGGWSQVCRPKNLSGMNA